MNTRYQLAALLTLAATVPALAEISINEKFAVSGYISGTAAYTETDGVKDGFMDVDAVKLVSTAKFDKVTGVASLHTFTSHDPVVLDAFATYSASSTTSVTMGKFLSYLGYEAFDYPNMLQISYANPIAGFIPAYHSGVKADYTSESLSAGFAVLDSVYGPAYYKGDGSFNNGGGLEAYVKLSSGDSSLFAAIAYDDGAGGYDSTGTLITDDRSTFDIWGQTKAGSITLAAEYCYSNLETLAGEASGHFWLALAMAPITDKWTITGRISGGEDEALRLLPTDPTPSFMKYTISPAVTITDNLGLLFEYSRINYDDHPDVEEVDFFAAQMIFKW